MEKINIGWAEVDITPEKPVSLRGQFHKRISERVESPLFATVMAVECGGEQMILCTCDLVAVSTDLVKMAKEKINGRAKGLDPSKIIIGATHTHTGPYADKNTNNTTLHTANEFLEPEKRYTEEKDPPGTMNPEECLEFISARISDAVAEAWNNKKTSYYSRQFGRAVTGHCRRAVYSDGSVLMYGGTNDKNFDCLEGSSDSGVELLYTFDAQKELSGIIVNVACPSQVVENECYISSDYWGDARRCLREVYGEKLFVLGQCSAAGDQSPRDLIRQGKDSETHMSGAEGKAEIGRRIAAAATEKYEAAKNNMTDTAKLIHETETIDFPLRTVSESEYQKAAEAFDAYVKASKKERFEIGDMVNLHEISGIMKRFEEQKTTSFFSSEIHCARLGDVAFATNPFELFLDFGFRIKARSRAAQTFLIQLACDCGSYLPTKKAQKGGHYSAYVVSGITGYEGGDLLVERTVEKINSFWK